jgi:hypothetical protein
LAQYIQQGIKQEYSTMNKVRISQWIKQELFLPRINWHSTIHNDYIRTTAKNKLAQYIPQWMK